MKVIRKTKVTGILATIFLIVCMTINIINPVNAEESDTAAGEVHYLGFASDLHDTQDTLENAFGNFPNDPEYVSLIGDMVGSRGGDAPVFNSSEILSRIRSIKTCGEIKSDGSNASIIWADHDAGVNDDAGIVKAMGSDPRGYLSGQIYEGKNEDGSAAYYIYAVGFYHMTSGGDISQNAAKAFKDWVDDKDPSVPILVLCHVPLQAKRGDNYGATYWNEALNYAATGVENITSDDAEDVPVTRNVFYLYGHNHTVDQNEYVFAPGSVMNVQIDDSSDLLTSSVDESKIKTTESYDEEVAQENGEDDSALQSESKKPNVTAKGIDSKVFYTAMIPGYLKTSGCATLMTITDDTISFSKYGVDGVTALGVSGEGETVTSPLIIDRIKVEDEADDGDDDKDVSNDNSDGDNDNDLTGDNGTDSSDDTEGSTSVNNADAPSEDDTTKAVKSADTGDINSMSVWIAAMFAAVVTLVVFGIRKRKN